MKKTIIAIAAGALALGGTVFTVASEALFSVNVTAVHSTPAAVNWDCRNCPFSPAGSVNWNAPSPDSVNWNGPAGSVNWNAPGSDSVNWNGPAGSVNWNVPGPDSVNWN